MCKPNAIESKFMPKNIIAIYWKLSISGFLFLAFPVAAMKCRECSLDLNFSISLTSKSPLCLHIYLFMDSVQSMVPPPQS